MRRLKRYLCIGVAACFLVGAGAGTFHYVALDNQPVQLWGTDDTAMHTVAVSSDSKGPTREQPVYIEVQVERLYGLHIGTPMKVRYTIKTLNSTKVRFDTLMRGVLSRYKTTWRLMGKPVLVSQEKKEGFTTRVIELTVSVWEPPVLDPAAPPVVPAATPADPAASAESAAAAQANPPPPKAQDPNAPPPPARQAQLWPFSAEFLYSTDKMANGLDKWEYIETPEIKFGFASLVEPGAKDLDFGPLGDIPLHYNRVGVGLMGGGSVIGLFGLAYLSSLFVGWLRRRRMPCELPFEVKLYRAARGEAELVKQRRSYLEQIRVAVRDYLGGATKTDEDLASSWSTHPYYERIVAMLSILQEAVTPGRLSGFEEQQVNKVMDDLIQARLTTDPKVGWFKRFWRAISTRLRLKRRR